MNQPSNHSSPARYGRYERVNQLLDVGQMASELRRLAFVLENKP
jgi:hypothetical protein